MGALILIAIGVVIGFVLGFAIALAVLPDDRLDHHNIHF